MLFCRPSASVGLEKSLPDLPTSSPSPPSSPPRKWDTPLTPLPPPKVVEINYLHQPRPQYPLNPPQLTSFMHNPEDKPLPVPPPGTLGSQPQSQRQPIIPPRPNLEHKPLPAVPPPGTQPVTKHSSSRPPPTTLRVSASEPRPPTPHPAAHFEQPPPSLHAVSANSQSQNDNLLQVLAVPLLKTPPPQPQIQHQPVASSRLPPPLTTVRMPASGPRPATPYPSSTLPRELLERVDQRIELADRAYVRELLTTPMDNLD